MSLREKKGRQIAEKSKITRRGNLWLVPSQGGHGMLYKVDFENGKCSCPDFEIRRQPCKHVFAVQFVIEKTVYTRSTVTESGKTTTTEKVEVERKTYRQEWPAYNKAQMNEKRLFLYLLNKLCQGVGSPAQYGAGRRNLPLEDVIFAMAFKVYSTVSGRRFMSDLRDAHAKGYISQVPSYNAMFDYFNTNMLTDYLLMLIEESSLPLSAIECDFAVDSTGISGCRFVQWVEAKYKDEKLMTERDWIKMHLITGVKTNVVTAVEITDKYKSDVTHFKPLVDATARNFRMREISADKAYLSGANLQAAANVQAVPYIPFKSNSSGKDKKQAPLWKQMWHYFSCHQERFMRSYHKRSNVETTFMMIKAKFGDSVRSKTQRVQINEALCKVLCHNICCLIHAMYELGLKPKFWSVAA
jgi:transposase/predicted nucleic acid-binding Zn finger protein